MESSNIFSTLIDGRECSKQLIDIIGQNNNNNNNNSSAKDLLFKIMEILDGIISTLSISSLTPSDVESGDALSTLFEESKSKASIFTISPSSSVDFVDRRGCKKRKRTQERVVKESTNLADDGHAWRKYGQKIIRDSNHPRDYFRCTNRFDQGCNATKQVQKVQNDPPKYRTIYFGKHMCKNLFAQPQNFLCDDHNTIEDVHDRTPVLFSFESSTATIKNGQNPLSFFPSSSSIENEHIIHDTEEQYQTISSHVVSSSSSYLSPLDMTIVSDEFMPIVSMLLSSDFYGDMIMAQSGKLDVNMNMAPLNYFDDVFDFGC